MEGLFPTTTLPYQYPIPLLLPKTRDTSVTSNNASSAWDVEKRVTTTRVMGTLAAHPNDGTFFIFNYKYYILTFLPLHFQPLQPPPPLKMWDRGLLHLPPPPCLVIWVREGFSIYYWPLPYSNHKIAGLFTHYTLHVLQFEQERASAPTMAPLSLKSQDRGLLYSLPSPLFRDLNKEWLLCPPLAPPLLKSWDSTLSSPTTTSLTQIIR